MRAPDSTHHLSGRGKMKIRKGYEGLVVALGMLLAACAVIGALKLVVG